MASRDHRNVNPGMTSTKLSGVDHSVKEDFKRLKDNLKLQMDQIDDLNFQIDDLKHQLDDHKRRTDDQEQQHHQDLTFLHELKFSDDHYRQRRREILENFKSNWNEPRSIDNVGDAVADARICVEASGKDKVFIDMLYGMPPKETLTLWENKNNAAIDVMNKYATSMMFDRRWGMTNELKCAFQVFLREILVDLKQSPLADPNSPLGKACSEFCRIWSEYRVAAESCK